MKLVPLFYVITVSLFAFCLGVAITFYFFTRTFTNFFIILCVANLLITSAVACAEFIKKHSSKN